MSETVRTEVRDRVLVVRLEREAKRIGIVTGAQAQVWFDLVCTGTDAHAGTTPPSARRDALVCTARIVDLVDRLMRARGEDGRGAATQSAHHQHHDGQGHNEGDPAYDARTQGQGGTQGATGAA